jgi:hypothetical protein
MAKRKYARFSDQQTAVNYECIKRKCKWQGTMEQKVDTPVKCDINHTIKTCPKCGGIEFYSLLNTI